MRGEYPQFGTKDHEILQLKGIIENIKGKQIAEFRDNIALQALLKLIEQTARPPMGSTEADELADGAYLIADAMLARRRTP